MEYYIEDILKKHSNKKNFYVIYYNSLNLYDFEKYHRNLKLLKKELVVYKYESFEYNKSNKAYEHWHKEILYLRIFTDATSFKKQLLKDINELQNDINWLSITLKRLTTKLIDIK